MAVTSRAEERQARWQGTGLLTGLALVVILAVLASQINDALGDYFKE